MEMQNYNQKKIKLLKLGAEVNIKDKATFSVVYFNRKETNFIDFIDLGGFVFQYKNIDEDFTASGLEFIADYKFFDRLNLNANATYTKVDEDLICVFRN